MPLILFKNCENNRYEIAVLLVFYYYKVAKKIQFCIYGILFALCNNLAQFIAFYFFMSVLFYYQQLLNYLFTYLFR